MGLLSRVCRSCSGFQRELREEQRRAHALELELVKAQTLAQVHRLEVERLEARLAARDSLPTHGGGFLPMPLPEAPPQQQVVPADDAMTFATRIDEIFGNGIDLNEFIRRQANIRKDQISALEQERTKIREELQQIP